MSGAGFEQPFDPAPFIFKMPIRSGKLFRECRKCGKSFEPFGGRENRVCEDCKPQKVNAFLAKVLAFKENEKWRGKRLKVSSND